VTDPATRYLANKLTAIEAIAGGRFDDALHIVQALRDGPALVQRGVCRYCGCSEARACGVLVLADDFLTGEPRVERCNWADEDCTVCTNVSCLERWRRESPAEMDVDVHDVVAASAPQSRIVLP
jgi:hypothetical protein